MNNELTTLQTRVDEAKIDLDMEYRNFLNNPNAFSKGHLHAAIAAYLEHTRDLYLCRRVMDDSK